MRSKRHNTALLVVVDKSAAARRAVEYVAKLVGRRRGFRLRLAHILAPVPPKLLEYRSVDDLDEQERLDARFEAKQRQWLAAATAAAARTEAITNATLRKAGVPAKAVSTLLSDPFDSHDAAEQILELARAHQCRTVVVGRQSISWFRKLMHGDLAAELVRRGEGFTIWVVE
jgi:nucleotide-binding universal stress UspA family protein